MILLQSQVKLIQFKWAETKNGLNEGNIKQWLIQMQTWPPPYKKASNVTDNLPEPQIPAELKKQTMNTVSNLFIYKIASTVNKAILFIYS